jgi:hypothetical protein
MKRSTNSDIARLLERQDVLRVQVSWLSALQNHTAAILLADILSACADQMWVGEEGRTVLFDGQELLLEYKHLARRLGVSVRSISRTMDHLTKLRLVSRSRTDRLINGTLTRNVVGVAPNLKAIAALSGKKGHANLAAPASKTPSLSDFQDSLLRAFADEFASAVGEDYSPTAQQQADDRRAAARLPSPIPSRQARKYYVWAQQYLDALKTKAEADLGRVQDACFDRSGLLKDAFTFSVFADWVRTNNPLPNGRARR